MQIIDLGEEENQSCKVCQKYGRYKIESYREDPQDENRNIDESFFLCTEHMELKLK